MKNLVILISGRGSNMEAILRASAAEHWPVKIAAVISNKADASGLQTAAAAGIATAVVNHKQYPDRDSFDAALAQVIDEYSPDLVVLAGFMRILTPGFVQRYHGRLLNIHPSLLPSFPGLATHQQAIDAGVKFHGATVHFVTPVLDHGPIIAQGVVPVLATDSPESLAARVLSIEHTVYAQVAIWLAQGRVHLLPDQRVTVDDVASRMFYPELQK